MKARIAVASALAAAVAAVALPQAAWAGDNSAATVSGVASKPASAGCPSGNFCIYTKPRWDLPGADGRVFQLFHCQTYSLQHWSGAGSWENQNTGGAHAQLKDRNGNVIVDSAPFPNDGWLSPVSYDFTPVWFVTAC